MVSGQPVSYPCSLDENCASDTLSPLQQLVKPVMGGGVPTSGWRSPFSGVQEKLEPSSVREAGQLQLSSALIRPSGSAGKLVIILIL